MADLNTTATASASMGPVLPEERIPILDILRGFALFGVLVANMSWFKSSPYYFGLQGSGLWTGFADWIAGNAIDFLIGGKFISLFSFLFGLGLAIQMSRAQARGSSIVPVYVRRLLVLLLIGSVHAWLIWVGDILVTYAVLGFPLLLFRNRSDRTLLTAAALFVLLVPLLLRTGQTVYNQLQSPEERAAARIERNARAEQARATYSQGTVLEIMVQRARDVRNVYVSAFALRSLPWCLGLFLLGLYAGRRRIFHDVAGNAALLRKVRWWGLGLGLVGNAVLLVAPAGGYWGPLRTLCNNVGDPALSAFYVTTIALAFQNEAWQRRLAPLGGVGRMVLTNYLLQSMVCTLIFYNYGLGLYGQVGPAMGLLLSIVIYVIQIPLSRWWLQQFRFGPVEWVWRSLTYGRRVGMRYATPAQAPPLSAPQGL